MKTTISIRDDLLRRLKARAALRGQPLSRYMEETLERSLQKEEEHSQSVAAWVEDLPPVSPEALEEFESVVASDDFRPIDPEMWR